MTTNFLPDDTALADAIYEAAVVPETWPAVLDRIAALSGTLGGAFIATPECAPSLVPLITPKLRWTNSPAVDELWAAFFGEGWLTRCAWVQRGRALEHPGFITDRDIFAPDEHERMPGYRFYRSHGVGWATALFARVPSGDRFAFTFERLHEDGPISPDIVERLNALRPHLARAALISSRLGLERARAAAEALAILGLPAAVLGPTHRALACNDLMQAMMPDRAEERAGGRFHLADPRADALLSQALANALVASCAASDQVYSVPVVGDGERPALVAHVVPLRGQARDIFVSAASIVILTPVASVEVPSATVIQGLFDLTAAETRVARMIASGETIGTIATASQTAEGTVRTQLKSVFAKTGVSRQIELAALLNATTLRRPN